MLTIAKREGLEIVEIIRELTSSSKKQRSNDRIQPEWLRVQSGKYTAILTWAPDRISVTLVTCVVIDPMDAGNSMCKNLLKTFFQWPIQQVHIYDARPQAKLENDQKSLNVKTR